MVRSLREKNIKSRKQKTKTKKIIMIPALIVEKKKPKTLGLSLSK